MDNAGSHRNIIVKDVISKTNNTLHYSVPYRPKTNAIETWFSQFKHYFIHEQRDKISYNDLKKIVKKAIKKVRKKSYYNIIEYAYKNHINRKIIKKQSTIKRKIKNYKK